MATIFFIGIILAIFHFVYESILLPSIRQRLRYKLFALRDRLVRLSLDNNQKTEIKHFEHIERSINTSIRHLPYMTISTIFHADNFYKMNPELQNDINRRVETIKNLKNEQLKELHSVCIKYSIQSLVYNSMMLFIYLLPIVLLISLIGVIRNRVKRTVQSLSVTPEYQFEKAVPYPGLYA